MIKFYHNSRCRKSRAGLQYLEGKDELFEIIEYLKNGISEDELRDVLIKMNVPPKEIIREQEDVFKKQFKGKNFTDDEWIKILVEHPKLIKRPLIVKGYKAVWADPPENMEKLFKKKK